MHRTAGFGDGGDPEGRGYFLLYFLWKGSYDKGASCSPMARPSRFMMRGSGSKNGGRRGKRGCSKSAVRKTPPYAGQDSQQRARPIARAGQGGNPGRVHHRRGKNRLALHQGQRDSAAAGPDRSIEPPAHIQKAPTVIPWGFSTFVFRASFAGDKVLHAVQSSRPAGEI